MEDFTLDKNKNKIEFTMNAHVSNILIKCVCLVTKNKLAISQWKIIISSLEISSNLKYSVYKDKEGRFNDERELTSVINFPFLPNQNQPIFETNQYICNEQLKIGINQETSFYKVLTIMAKEINLINEDYKLVFTVKKHKIIKYENI